MVVSLYALLRVFKDLVGQLGATLAMARTVSAPGVGTKLGTVPLAFGACWPRVSASPDASDVLKGPRF